jgi:hypothetical protein
MVSTADESRLVVTMYFLVACSPRIMLGLVRYKWNYTITLGFKSSPCLGTTSSSQF